MQNKQNDTHESLRTINNGNGTINDGNGTINDGNGTINNGNGTINNGNENLNASKLDEKKAKIISIGNVVHPLYTSRLTL